VGRSAGDDALAGPVGVGAIQAGRVLGASQVIAIEPVRYRREFALKMGATTAIDPVVEGAGLVERIREMCKGPTDRRFAGGMSWSKAPNAAMARGADFVVEAAGVQVVKLIEQGRLDAKSMITRTYRLAEGRQAVQDVADRTVITAVILFDE
jgi:threonine dehydrogenase-like Zn-dependent dehydrogenase